jgi:hypothetical protein
LSESAINFISQDSYEKSLILLQKGIIVCTKYNISLNSSNNVGTDLSRVEPEGLIRVSPDPPQYGDVLSKVMNNLAILTNCRLGILEECALCLEGCLVSLSSEYLQ